MSDPSPARSPPEAEPKQLRTAWRLRRRYRRARRLASAAGAALALAIVAAAAVGLPDHGTAMQRGFVISSGLLVALCAGLPWLGVGMLWRRTSRRNRHEWIEGAPY